MYQYSEINIFLLLCSFFLLSCEWRCLVTQDEAGRMSWPRCQTWHIPCHIKPHATPFQPSSPVTPAQSSSRHVPSPSLHSQSRSHQLSPLEQRQESHPGDDKLASEELPVPQVVHLDVSTCAVLPVLAVQGEGASWQPEPGVWEFDFGMHCLCSDNS